jgi:hypothetical protein
LDREAGAAAVRPSGADPRPDGLLALAALLDGLGDQGGFLLIMCPFVISKPACHARLRGGTGPGRKSVSFKGWVHRVSGAELQGACDTEARGLERHTHPGGLPTPVPCW